MKRSKWKRELADLGLRALVPNLPERAAVNDYDVWPFDGRSLGFGADRARKYGHPVPSVRSTRSESTGT